MISKFKNLYIKLLIANKVMSISNIVMIAIVTCIMALLFNISLNAENQLKMENMGRVGEFELEAGYSEGTNKFITEDIEKNILEIESIEKISPAIVTNLQIDGISVYTLGLISDELSKSKYKFESDLVDNRVAINKELSEAKKLKVGDAININSKKVIVDEIFEDDLNSASGLNMIIVNKNFLENSIEEPIGTKFIMIKVKDNISKVVENIGDIDKSFEILILEDNEYLKENVASLRYFLIFIGILIFLICGIFTISNLQHYLYKYTKDFAIMKMLGGTSNQIFHILFMQGLVLNILGISFGIILHCIFTKLILVQYKILILPILITSVVGFLTLQITLIFPAYKTLKILPIKALTNRERKLKRKTKVGFKYINIILLFGIIVGIKNIIIQGGKNSFFECILAFVLIFISMIAILKRKLPQILSSIEKKCGNLSICKISIMTMKTQFEKNFIIIIAIVILICINIMGGSFVNLLEINNEKYYKSEYLEDIVVNGNMSIDGDLASDIFEDITKVKGISSYMRLDGGTMDIKIANSAMRGTFSIGTLKEMSKSGLIKEYKSDSENIVVITDKLAKENNIKIGEKINLISPTFENKGTSTLKEPKKYNVELEVIDIVTENITRFSEVMIDLNNNEMIEKSESFLDKIFIKDNENNINKNLREMKRKYTGLKWQSLEEVLYNTNKEINDRWEIFNVAIILILLTTIFGVVNSIKDNMNSCRKEYAILRCMKFTRGNLIKMLIIQMIIFLLVGIIIGILLGSIGSVLMTSIDTFNLIMPKMNLLIISAITTILIMAIYLIPYIIKFSRIEISKEISREEG